MKKQESILSIDEVENECALSMRTDIGVFIEGSPLSRRHIGVPLDNVVLPASCAS